MGQQDTRVPATREQYIDAMTELAYMAQQVIFDADSGRNPEPVIGLLRKKVTAWETTRDSYLGPVMHDLRRSSAVHAAHEDLEAVSGE